MIFKFLRLACVVLFLPGNLTTNGHVTGHPESERAETAFYQSFPPDPNTVDELVVVRSSTHTIDDRAFKAFVTRLYAQGAATGVVGNAFDYYTTGDRSLVSADRHACRPPGRLERAARTGHCDHRGQRPDTVRLYQ